MLDSAEQSLVKRDLAIPGLATLLDVSRFAERLQRLAPGAAIEAIVPTYLRYKPGTRCLAAYTCRVAGQEISLHAVAHGEDAAVRLEKARSRAWQQSPLGDGVLLDPAQGIAIFPFPNDLRVASLGWVDAAEPRHELLRRVFSEAPELWNGTLRRLAYKPERRYVAAVELEGVPRAVLKLYTRAGFASLQQVTLALVKDQRRESVVRLGRSQRRAAIGFRWVEGTSLQDVIANPARDLGGAVHTGEAIAALHARRAPRGSVDVSADIAMTQASAETVGRLLPHLAPRLSEVAGVIAARLSERSAAARITHGDFYAKQVVVTSETATLLDLDELGWGDPLRDLGVFGAHLLRDAVGERVSFVRAEAAQEALLGGYEVAAEPIDREGLELYTAAAALWITPHYFRGRDADWPLRTESLLATVEDLTRNEPRARRKPAAPLLDKELPFLEWALDRTRAVGPLAKALEEPALQIEHAELLRHKPGRRCVVAYLSRVEGERRWLIGKVRARGLDRSTYECVRALVAAGFDASSADGISVPEPLGTVPAFRMWLQQRVGGMSGERVLVSEEGPALALRTAEFLHKLQRSQLPCARIHTIEDELRILHARISQLARSHPEWASRLGRVLRGCDARAAALPGSMPVPAHRDLHPGQLLMDEGRLQVLDFDLFCAADSALDAGNFAAHIIELGLRLHGDPDAFAECEQALEASFLARAGAGAGVPLRDYTTLSLARHISLSTQFPDRVHTTEALLDLCERRLDVGFARVDAKQMDAPV
jgi:hypothetical protein